MGRRHQHIFIRQDDLIHPLISSAMNSLPNSQCTHTMVEKIHNPDVIIEDALMHVVHRK